MASIPKPNVDVGRAPHASICVLVRARAVYVGEVRSRAAHKPHHRPARERQRRQSSETIAEVSLDVNTHTHPAVCSRHHDRRHHLEASRARANAHPDLECTSGAKGTLRTQTHANSKTWCFAAARQTQPSRAAELSSLERPERALRVERACCAAPRPRPRTPAGHGHEREQPCAQKAGRLSPRRLHTGFS